MEQNDLLVIGGGPGGYAAALQASKLGAKVTLVEGEKLGGICLNWGCHPVLFLARCVSLLHLMKEVSKDGINMGTASIDFAKLMAAKDDLIHNVLVRMQNSLKANNVELLKGWASLVSANQVEVEFDNGSKQLLTAKKIIVASGSASKRYPVPGAEGQGVITAKELLGITDIPKRLIIIGRSVTALELATIWVKLGCNVILVGRGSQLLPGEDLDMAVYIEDVLKEDGVQIYKSVDIDSIDDTNNGKSITIYRSKAKHRLEADLVVFAIGQAPVVNGFGLEDIGVEIIDGRIQTNKRMETSVKGVYAVGDATGGAMLANVAMAQGSVAAENALGQNSAMDYRVIPRCVRTWPQIASVGITEREATQGGLDVRISKFPLEANTKASVLRERSGFVKIVAGSKSGEIMGVHIIGPQAIELIGEAVMIMQMKATVSDVARAMHAHPSLHEAIKSAAQAL
jgi:dihydrolipoamide dehydrogenase